jgi:dsRNA-specific ribonuclease
MRHWGSMLAIDMSASQSNSDPPHINPKSALIEKCQKFSLPMPTWTMWPSTGPPHKLVFHASGHVGAYTEEGHGSTKKEAEADAAEKLLFGLATAYPHINYQDAGGKRKKQASAVVDPSAPHPKTELTGLCQQYMLGPPTYELVERSGPSHSPLFRARVIVGVFYEDGTGFSKKEAETRAAEKMYSRLRGGQPHVSLPEYTL